MNTMLTDNFYYYFYSFYFVLTNKIFTKEFLKVGFFDSFWKKMECLKMLHLLILH